MGRGHPAMGPATRSFTVSAESLSARLHAASKARVATSVRGQTHGIAAIWHISWGQTWQAAAVSIRAHEHTGSCLTNRWSHDNAVFHVAGKRQEVLHIHREPHR